MGLDRAKEEMIWCCQQMDRRQFVANHDGNLSLRLNETEFLATPTARAKGSLGAKDLLIVDIKGSVLVGEGKIFSEWSWHRAIYENFENVTSVAHAHPPYLTALGLVNRALGTPAIPEAIVSLGAPLVCVDSVEARSPEGQRAAVLEGLMNAYGFSVSGNGGFAAGDTTEMAYLRLELMEQVARAQTLAQEVGTLKKLPADWVEELKSKRPPLKPLWRTSLANSVSPQAETSPDSLVAAAKASPASSPKPAQEPLLDKVRALILEELKKLDS